jgi:hypothetical protein
METDREDYLSQAALFMGGGRVVRLAAVLTVG